MNDFEAYKTYLGIKLHFTTNYNFIKYNGKVSATVDSFKSRSDRYYFKKLAKHKDLVRFLVANFIADDHKWVGDLLSSEAQETYNKWLKYHNAITYHFKQELLKFKNIKTILNIPDNDYYPELLDAYLHDEVSIDTIVILDDMLHFLEDWKKNIQDDVLYPEIHEKFMKYRPFINYDKDKLKGIVKDIVNSSSESECHGQHS